MKIPPKKLTINQIHTELETLPMWGFSGDRLEKIFIFKDFIEAMVFVNECVNPIQSAQSFPRVTITYNRVHFSIFDNTVGALSQDDILLAREIEQLAKRFIKA